MQAVLFMGLQASGKSSFYLQQFYQTHIRLNMDMLRTRHREQILLSACLTGKQPFVIDNTNPTREDRERYIVPAKEHRFSICGYYFQSSLEQCLTRNAARYGKAKIPDIALKGTHNKLVLPSYDEGFDELFYVTMMDNGFQVEKWQA